MGTVPSMVVRLLSTERAAYCVGVSALGGDQSLWKGYSPRACTARPVNVPSLDPYPPYRRMYGRRGL
ncbi:hypothetical protein BDZ89DRAFT_1063065 [Hymenopellis radicata]|nr:hypothetical protein BDZ89DRAFT_1063065 [Hymenopellis radicata]